MFFAGFKPQHGQIIARVVAGSSPRAVISSGDTKSIAVSFTQTATKTTINSSGKPATTPATTQATSPDKTNQAFPVNIKHQVVGKFVTAQGNQQILVQNQAGLLKNSKNQPLVAKFVTQGSHNAAHMIKVLSNPQGQPFIGKISTGGINSKPIVAKITNAQGQPIYSMEDLFSQSNKGECQLTYFERNYLLLFSNLFVDRSPPFFTILGILNFFICFQ